MSARIVPGHQGMYAKNYHFVKAGGGKRRASICGKVVAAVKSWRCGTGGLRPCAECVEIAVRKYGLVIA